MRGRRRDLWWTVTVAGFLAVLAFLVYPLAAVLVTSLCKYLINIIETHISQSVLARMRNALLEHIITLPLSFFRKTQPGTVVNAVLPQFGTNYSQLTAPVPTNGLFNSYVLLAVPLFILAAAVKIVRPALQELVDADAAHRLRVGLERRRADPDLQFQSAAVVAEPRDGPDEQYRQHEMVQRHQPQPERILMVPHVFGAADQVMAQNHRPEHVDAPERLADEHGNRLARNQQAARCPQADHGDGDGDIAQVKKICDAVIAEIDGKPGRGPGRDRDFHPERNRRGAREGRLGGCLCVAGRCVHRPVSSQEMGGRRLCQLVCA